MHVIILDKPQTHDRCIREFYAEYLKHWDTDIDVALSSLSDEDIINLSVKAAALHQSMYEFMMTATNILTKRHPDFKILNENQQKISFGYTR